MIYNILSIADIHWGATNPETLFDDLESVLLFIKKKRDIDIVVICGDYFDAKMSLNSKAAILSIRWMEILIETCKQNNVKKIRIIKGTQEHDNSQLEVFREKETEYFKIFNENTVEETLPGLVAMYCPDENINAVDYKEKYIENILKYPNIGFFHGSFDIVLPDIVVQLSEETSAKSIIYDYSFWSKYIKGPMIAGHWHSSLEEGNLIYIGSFERWEFNEPEDKGFGFIRFDTDTNEYFYTKIVNQFAETYKTFEINTSLYRELVDYNRLMEDIKKFRADNPYAHIRIKINIDDEKDSNNTFITSLRHYYINDKLIKIDLKDKLKKEKAKIEKKHHAETKDKFGFVMSYSMNEAQKIQEFISVTKNKDIPIDVINTFIQKYIDKVV